VDAILLEPERCEVRQLLILGGLGIELDGSRHRGCLLDMDDLEVLQIRVPLTSTEINDPNRVELVPRSLDD